MGNAEGAGSGASPRCPKPHTTGAPSITDGAEKHRVEGRKARTSMESIPHSNGAHHTTTDNPSHRHTSATENKGTHFTRMCTTTVCEDGCFGGDECGQKRSRIHT